MILLGWKNQTVILVALLCNIAVSGQGTWIFWRNDYLKWKQVFPFVVLSIPMAFLGGLYKITSETWSITLGISLILAGIALFLPSLGKEKKSISLSEIHSRLLWPMGLGLGGGLGFLAGLVGIGGGIFLAPILHFLGKGKGREIAALTSAFIFLNSASGLIGQGIKSRMEGFELWHLALILAVIAGGRLGNLWATKKLSHFGLRYWTAALVVTAGLRLLWKYF